jgi:hypothetical protein
VTLVATEEYSRVSHFGCQISILVTIDSNGETAEAVGDFRVAIETSFVAVGGKLTDLDYSSDWIAVDPIVQRVNSSSSENSDLDNMGHLIGSVTSRCLKPWTTVQDSVLDVHHLLAVVQDFDRLERIGYLELYAERSVHRTRDCHSHSAIDPPIHKDDVPGFPRKNGDIDSVIEVDRLLSSRAFDVHSPQV